MLKRSILFGFALMLLLASAAYAQGPGPKHSDPNWQASYWNNVALSGEPIVQETSKTLHFDWGDGSPHASINSDGFSARWTRYLDLATGTYRFTATSDDGIRVYVDNSLLIDQWHDHPSRTYTADVSLVAGHHLVVVEYYENAGAAVAKLSWAPVSVGTDEWQGEYFDNRSLGGSPALIRGDASIDFGWDYGSPAAGIPSNDFSVRWTRTVPFPVGEYRFTATIDDGVRVYIDERLIIDQWQDHSVRSYSSDLWLAGGPHKIIVEYYERTGVATARFSWARISSGTDEWQGEYFDNRSLDGSPVLTRGDKNIDFDWGYGTPASNIPSDSFSIRWTRTVRLESGQYRFTTTTDDGVRLWVNGHLLIDKWQDQASRSHSGTIHVSGDVPIKMEYFESGGAASARLAWTRIDDDPAPQPSGTVVVDNADPGFRRGGAPEYWHDGDAGYNGGLIWTWNNDKVRPNYNWARWYPDLEPGTYEVYVYVPESYATTTSARYWVAHHDGFTLRKVSQAANKGQWISLGTYQFRGTDGEYVSLADITYESYLSRQVAFDAVKWVSR
jgi:hypothetical protein